MGLELLKKQGKLTTLLFGVLLPKGRIYTLSNWVAGMA